MDYLWAPPVTFSVTLSELPIVSEPAGRRHSRPYLAGERYKMPWKDKAHHNCLTPDVTCTWIRKPHHSLGKYIVAQHPDSPAGLLGWEAMLLHLSHQLLLSVQTLRKTLEMRPYRKVHRNRLVSSVALCVHLPISIQDP